MIDIAIIGGGPAGLSAAIYAARGGANTVLFEEVFVGGQAATTERIDNYPGFVEGINGGELGMLFEKQAKRFGVEIRYGAVAKLELAGNLKRIHQKNEILEARALILAMGAKPKPLGIAGESDLVGAGVSYCATCDGAFFRGRDVAVVGGGDTALADALYLSRFANKVYLVHRRDAYRAAKVLRSAVEKDSKVVHVQNSVITALQSEGALTGITVENVQTHVKTEIPVAGLFVAVGITPHTALVQDQLRLSEYGYIETDRLLRTSIGGVFAAGDVRDTPLRQVITAAADGAVAATAALDYMNEMGFDETP